MRALPPTLIATLLLASAFAQAPAPPSPQTFAPPAAADASTTPAGPGTPVAITAAADHQRMMDLLHLKQLRPGVKQDGTGPYPVNWDEAKANPWPKLPDPLLLNNGKPVKTAKVWSTKRRPELVEIFDREILGRAPAHTPAVRWEVTGTGQGSVGDVATITRHLVGHVDNSIDPAITVNILADLILPADAQGPVPVVMEITFDRPPGEPPPPPRPPRTGALAASAAAARPPDGPSPRLQTLAKGWGYALLYPTTFQADNGGGLTRGIIGLCNHGQPRKLEDWGALRAWGWGASRLLDYLETDKAVDAKHVAVAGHSRFGKAALVTMAYDQRFAVAYVNSSGAGGADLARRRFGEQQENIAGGEYYWMGGNYIKYAGTLTPADMPVDMHELIALCAPRPVFIGGGTYKGGDGWADVDGTFIAEVAAKPVYTLLGKKGVSDATGPVTALPPVGTPLVAGELAFRQHPGGHTIQPNFATFLDWSSRYMTPTAPGSKSAHSGH
jgi:hypothetical protein